MLPKRYKMLSACLVWTSALGLSLTVFAIRPPCACSLKHAEQAPPACPHCAKAAEHDCCQPGTCGTDDCECPCCQSTPADQPLLLELATSPQPVDTGALLLAISADHVHPFTSSAVATGGWRCGQLDGYHPPNLANLCRWII